MLVVVPFHDCLARPPASDGRVNLLSEHLQAVAEAWGRSGGKPVARLRFLAGLMHDAGKARTTWQDYIRGKRSGHVAHSPLGAVVFAYCADCLLSTCGRGAADGRLRLEIMRLSRDICDHHGSLDDLTDKPPWCEVFSSHHLVECDLAGLFGFVQGFFPEITLSPKGLRDWLAGADRVWCRWFQEFDLLAREIDHACDRHGAAAALCIRERTAGLIAADRWHASGFERSGLLPVVAERGLQELDDYCASRARWAEQAGAHPRLIAARQYIQEEAVRRFRSAGGHPVYTLQLPTGSGKTLTALRVALTTAATGKCERVIYVAPYMSILSQAAAEIRRATGLEVLQHHHLSILELPADEGDERAALELLTLDSWQSPVVATTFNQLFAGLFPRRAQQSMRVEGLKRAFVILDEPQIIDAAVWNLLLRLLRAAADSLGTVTLLTTATLPPLEYGLVDAGADIAPPVDMPARYNVVTSEEPLDEEGVAALALGELRCNQTVCVVLNTIRDVARVHERISARLGPEVRLFVLTGAMTPLHKAERIRAVAESLRLGHPTVVVSTQVLEAGVDLSFSVVMRATPVIPSIAQVAGRANRHAEKDAGRVIVFSFLRRGVEDTRRYVYRCGIAREETDISLRSRTAWGEVETHEVVSEYYERVFARNPHTAYLQKLRQAATGTWSALSGIEPFGAYVPGVELFAPYLPAEPPHWLMSGMSGFGAKGPEDLYEMYAGGALGELGFVARRRFMALLQHFSVGVAEKVGRLVGVGDRERGIWRMRSPDLYSPETGLAHVSTEDDEFEMYCI